MRTSTTQSTNIDCVYGHVTFDPLSTSYTKQCRGYKIMPVPISGLFQLPSSRVQEPLRAIKSIEGAAIMQPCALTLTKPQTKTNV